VVGVIVNLALFFATQVLWPQGYGGAFDIACALLALAAAVALFRFKRSVVEVIVVSALLGWLWTVSGIGKI
jgi:chromate transporter